MASLSAGRTALVIRHQESVHLGSFAGLLERHGYELQHVDAASIGGSTVDADAADLVVVLGGEMGVYEAERHPFITAELRLLARRLQAEQPTLGICLGAQMMAESLGGRASKGKSTVIGFRAIQLTDAGRDSPLRHLDGVPVMQWHGDSFRLPAGATRLASSAEYSNEAFRLGDYALAIQFHAELTGAMYEEWVAGSAAELAAHGIDPAVLLAQRDEHGARMERAAAAMLTEWLDTL